MDGPIVTKIWHVQEGTNLTQNKVRSFKEVGFVINKRRSIQPWSLFGGKKYVPITLIVYKYSVMGYNAQW
jgi:hypothetical protein